MAPEATNKPPAWASCSYVFLLAHKTYTYLVCYKWQPGFEGNTALEELEDNYHTRWIATPMRICAHAKLKQQLDAFRGKWIAKRSGCEDGAYSTLTRRRTQF